MIAMKTNIPMICNKLLRLQLLAGKGGWQDDIVKTMDNARRLVRVTTPQSKGVKKITGRKHGRTWKQNQHLREGWKLHIIGKGGKDRVPVLAVVYNHFTHKPSGEPREKALVTRLSKAGNLIVSHGPTGKPYTVLDILEWGSKEHEIVPKRAQFLHFEIGGEEIFTKHVAHHGTKPYGMVRKTRVVLIRWMQKINRKWARRFAREFMK